MERFEEKRESLLRDLGGLEPALLEARPLEGKWSIIEIVEHMVVAEREVLMGLPDHGDLRDTTRSFRNKLMRLVVMFVLRNRIRVKVPSRTMLPNGGGQLEDLRRRWDENQAWFRSYVDSCDEQGLKRAVFKHPVSGPIDVHQAVDMSIAHLDSHTEQIRRLIELSGQ